MFNLKPPYANKKGFTLIELILGIAISSLLIITFYNVLDFNLKINEKVLLEDEVLLNGRYILEYIKDEIISADKIVSSDYFEDLNTKFPTNIGFVIVKVMEYEKANPELKDDKYIEKEWSYTTYYFKDKKIIRINGKASGDTYPYVSIFKGYNKVGEMLLENSHIILKENNLIDIDLSLGKNENQASNFKSTVVVRCPLVR